MNFTHSESRSSPCKPPEAPTIFVIDGDPSVREALDLLIRSAGWQPRPAASAEEFLARPRLMSPCCLLTELHLPGVTGLELQRLVCDRRELPIVFMSTCADVRVAVQAMKRGAFELLIKPFAADLVFNAINAALERSRAALTYLSCIEILRARYASLSAREKEVISLVTAGRLNKQVAGDLGIVEDTVKVHRGRAMRKMQARSFAELVTMIENLRRDMPAIPAWLPSHPESLLGRATFEQSPHALLSDSAPA